MKKLKRKEGCPKYGGVIIMNVDEEGLSAENPGSPGIFQCNCGNNIKQSQYEDGGSGWNKINILIMIQMNQVKRVIHHLQYKS